MVMVGGLGVQMLAGVGLAVSICAMVMAFLGGLNDPITPLAARSHGANDIPEMLAVVRQGLWLGLFGAVVTCLLLWWTQDILLLLKQDPALSELAGTYMRYYLWSVPLVLIFWLLGNLLLILEHSKWVVFLAIAGVILNIPLNYLLIFGGLGIPALGIVGSAIASVLVAAVQTVGIVCVLAFHPDLKRYGIFQNFPRPDLARIGSLLRLGLPMTMEPLLLNGALRTSNLMVGATMVAVLPAQMIVMEIFAMAATFLFSVRQAVLIRVGIEVGRRALGGVWRLLVSGIALGGIFCVVTAAVLWLFPRHIFSLFLGADSPGAAVVLDIAPGLLSVVAVALFAAMVQDMLMGALNGLLDVKYPAVVTAIGIWGVGIGGFAVLVIPFGLGLAAVWWIFTAAFATVAICLALRLAFLIRGWKPGLSSSPKLSVES
jgi:MATE family multidrug resistance protein